MNGKNKVFIAGNLLAKPALQKSKKGRSFSYLKIATNRFSYIEGQWKKTTYWHSVLVWGKTAEACEKFLEKGFPLAIEGFLESAKSKNYVVAEDVHFLSTALRTQDLTVMSSSPPSDTHEALKISMDD